MQLWAASRVQVFAKSLPQPWFSPVDAGSSTGSTSVAWDMVVAFVRCHASLEPACKQTSRIYALVLPGVNNTDWEEVNVRPSLLGGHGLFPRQVRQELDWLDLSSTPVAMPYLGVETVVKGRQLLNTFVEVLQGRFECCTLCELQQQNDGGQMYMADGLYVVPTSGVAPDAELLPPETELLQVRTAGGGNTSASYLLADDVRSALHLTGAHSHLFDGLSAGGEHEQRICNLATHLAVLQRMEADAETGVVSQHHVHIRVSIPQTLGCPLTASLLTQRPMDRDSPPQVIINAHPAFAEPLSVVGMVNEPPPGETPNMKMVLTHAHFLANTDPLMMQMQLTQPAGAEAAWRQHIQQPVGASSADAAAAGGELWRFAEKMLVYVSTRKSYTCDHELTVNYGNEYRRHYKAGRHLANHQPPDDSNCTTVLVPNESESLVDRMKRVARHHISPSRSSSTTSVLCGRELKP